MRKNSFSKSRRNNNRKVANNNNRKVANIVQTRSNKTFVNAGNKSIGSDGYGYRHYGRITVRSDGLVFVR